MRRAAILCVLLPLFFLSAPASGQYFTCPAGSMMVQNPNGQGQMCQCADGSFAGMSGCQQQYTAPPPGVPCGGGYCPAGLVCSRAGSCIPPDVVDCGSFTCSTGMKCGPGMCLPLNTGACGSGYCQPGQMCTVLHRCVSPRQDAHGGILDFFNILARPFTNNIQRAANSISISQSINAQPPVTLPWVPISIQPTSPGGPVIAPANSPQMAASYNPFTNSYSIPAANSNAAPNFASPPVQPALQTAIQASKPMSDNLNNIGTMQMQPPPSQPNAGTGWVNPDPYNTHCTGAFSC